MKEEINISRLNIKKRQKENKSVFGIFAPFIAVVLALLVGALIIAMAGASPLYAYQWLLYGAFGSLNSFSETLIKTTPLLISGLGLAIAFRSNMISIGAEGQIIMGGLFATLAGLYITGLPAVVMIPLLIIAGFIGGAIWGAIPGLLKAKLGVSEIINTIMLNYIALYFVNYLLDIPLREPPGYFPQSAQIVKEAWLPVILPGTRLHAGFLLGLLLVVAYYFLMFRLPLGYKIRAVGLNPHAARYGGINVERNMVIAMALSGGLAGIAGMSEIAGVQHRLLGAFSSGYGFDAIAVALLGKLHPLGVLASALFFGALRVGANSMQRAAQVPASVVYVIQGLVVIFVLTDTFLQKHMVSWRKSRPAKKTSGEEA
ncbi:ABC transporter permease [Zhaonella formicivorans]|uniref:ABC transporter permease n=1 Tax=Zhaonella formicivorans TaxID=2528593 RepID=UPI0010D924F8|nr:ABC transporter permease [Zhaonella formicivorans]